MQEIIPPKRKGYISIILQKTLWIFLIQGQPIVVLKTMFILPASVSKIQKWAKNFNLFF